MNATLQHDASAHPRSTRRISPSTGSAQDAKPFTLDQELTPFGKWVDDPIWVPPKDSSSELAKSMLDQFGWLASKKNCWNALIEEHRSQFTQVRAIEMSKESIRLPKTTLFVSVTEQSQFDQITDSIPNCVRTRLEEFLAGPGKKPGVKVYYLKPLCVEVGDELIFTTQDELSRVISEIQNEVFQEYRWLYLTHRPLRFALNAIDAGLHLPRKAWKHYAQRRKRAIEAYHAKLEFNRRKAVWRAAKCRSKYRTDACTFDDLLSLTKTPDRIGVIEQYAIEHQLTPEEKQRLLRASVATLPWFMTMSIGIYYISKFALATAMLTPPVLVCDPAFVAEMPGSDGVVLKIGHFDEIAGVTHVEI
jgi:hypothetical protein